MEAIDLYVEEISPPVIFQKLQSLVTDVLEVRRPRALVNQISGLDEEQSAVESSIGWYLNFITVRNDSVTGSCLIFRALAASAACPWHRNSLSHWCLLPVRLRWPGYFASRSQWAEWLQQSQKRIFRKYPRPKALSLALTQSNMPNSPDYH